MNFILLLNRVNDDSVINGIFGIQFSFCFRKLSGINRGKTTYVINTETQLSVAFHFVGVNGVFSHRNWKRCREQNKLIYYYRRGIPWPMAKTNYFRALCCFKGIFPGNHHEICYNHKNWILMTADKQVKPMAFITIQNTLRTFWTFKHLFDVWQVILQCLVLRRKIHDVIPVRSTIRRKLN